MIDYKFRHYCIGDNPAEYICLGDNCAYTCPFLCAEPKNCPCREHLHGGNQMMSMKEFLKRIREQNAPDLINVNDRLKTCLKNLKNSSALFMKQQQKKVDQFINGLRRKYSSQASAFNSFKDLENSSGKQIRDMVVIKEPARNIIPESVKIVVDKSINEIARNYNAFIESFKVFIPDINTLERKQSKRTVQKVQYVNQAAPIKQIVETVDMKVLILEKAQLDSLEVFQNFSSTSLKILSLQHNGLTDFDIGFIVRARLPNLVEFKAWNNEITDKGAEMIAKADWRLGYFNLHSNRISSQGAVALINRYHQNLFRFDLDYNFLDDLFAVAIKKLYWEKLTEVHLAGNNFTPECRKDINDFFKSLKLQKLYIFSAY